MELEPHPVALGMRRRLHLRCTDKTHEAGEVERELREEKVEEEHLQADARGDALQVCATAHIISEICLSFS